MLVFSCFQWFCLLLPPIDWMHCTAVLLINHWIITDNELLFSFLFLFIYIFLICILPLKLEPDSLLIWPGFFGTERSWFSLGAEMFCIVISKGVPLFQCFLAPLLCSARMIIHHQIDYHFNQCYNIGRNPSFNLYSWVNFGAVNISFWKLNRVPKDW